MGTPYKCKNFKIEELVGPDTFQGVPEWKLWIAFDDRLLRLIDRIRDHLDCSITINDWLWGGGYTESGLRREGMKHYNPWSQHASGRAVDMKFKGKTADEVRKELAHIYHMGMFNDISVSITCEENVTWVHLDVRNNAPGYNGFYV